MRITRLMLACSLVLAGMTIVIATRHDQTPTDEVLASLPRRLDARELRLGEPVFIRLFKEESELELWMRGPSGWTLFQTYAICRWSGDLGPKLKTGDKQAPEGFYSVSLDQLNPNSRWHKSFNIGFPNE